MLTPEFINHLFTEHKIDYIVHGDDPCLLPDGTDAYDYPKSVGRFRMVRRWFVTHHASTHSSTQCSLQSYLLSDLTAPRACRSERVQV